MSAEASQRGREWEVEVASLVGGELQPGSGNQVQAPLDVVAGGLLVECKHTDAESYRLTVGTWEKVLVAAGPETVKILALRMGAGGRRLGVVDLDVLVGWLEAGETLAAITYGTQSRSSGSGFGGGGGFSRSRRSW